MTEADEVQTQSQETVKQYDEQHSDMDDSRVHEVRGSQTSTRHRFHILVGYQ